MEFKEVKSSNIKRVGYEGDNLIVEYLNGSRYKYKKVPELIYTNLLESDSKGRFINNCVKGKFEYERLLEEQSK